MTGLPLQFFQQFAGINTVMYYSAKIITMAGVSSKSLAIWLSAAVASMNFVWTLPGMLLVERVGRRKLLIVSLTGQTVSHSTHSQVWSLSSFKVSRQVLIKTRFKFRLFPFK